MTGFDFDLVVIGGGSGGVRAARVAAQLGARVALVEAELLGGTCVNLGCIPKKLFYYAAELAHAFEDAAGYGFEPAQPRLSWSTLLANKDVEIRRLNAVYLGLLEKAGVELVWGRAQVIGPNAVQVGERQLRARHLLIATGSKAHLLDLPGAEHAICSDQAFHLERLPRRAMLIGGGYIALEFAGIFSALGCEVQVVHHGEQILRGFDREVRDHLAGELREQGIAIRCGTELRVLQKHGSELRAELSSGSREVCDLVMFATGRLPNTAGLGLEAAGVVLDARGGVETDAYCRSSAPSIFAVGDCTGRSGLTPVAIAEGQAVAQTLFGGQPRTADLDSVPTAVFSQPSVATVGLPEHEARALYADVTAYRATFTPLKHRLTGRARKTLVKIVVDAQRDRVLGCHMVGADAPEIIQGFAVALKLGVTKAQMDATIGLHPTAAEEFVTLR